MLQELSYSYCLRKLLTATCCKKFYNLVLNKIIENLINKKKILTDTVYSGSLYKMFCDPCFASTVNFKARALESIFLPVHLLIVDFSWRIPS